MRGNKVAIAPFLRSCPSVITLGIRETLGDYSEEERLLLGGAERVFFPTPRFIDVFRALGRPTFPSPFSYEYQRSRLAQQLLFKYLRWPHPASRVYFGGKRKERIARDFELPCLAMSPALLPGTIRVVRDSEGLRRLVSDRDPVIIRKWVKWEERIRFLFVDYDCLGVQRCFCGDQHSEETAPESFEPVGPDCGPFQKPRDAALELLRKVQLDDMLVEWGYGEGKWQIIEMRRPPVRWRTERGELNRHDYVCELIRSGRL